VARLMRAPRFHEHTISRALFCSNASISLCNHKLSRRVAKQKYRKCGIVASGEQSFLLDWRRATSLDSSLFGCNLRQYNPIASARRRSRDWTWPILRTSDLTCHSFWPGIFPICLGLFSVSLAGPAFAEPSEFLQTASKASEC
jgi:hypothetical protein